MNRVRNIDAFVEVHKIANESLANDPNELASLPIRLFAPNEGIPLTTGTLADGTHP